MRQIVVVPLTFGALACSGPPGELGGAIGHETSAIEGGELDTEHDSVFALVASNRNFISTCTATLIAPNVLLTARHCVASTADTEVICGRAEFGRLYDPDNLYASNPVLLSQRDLRWFRGSMLRVPTEGDDTCGFDVALLMLSENVPPEIAVPSTPRIDRAVEQGEPYVAVGYGVDGSGEQQGGRQVLTNQNVRCAPGQCRQANIIRPNEFIGGTGICSGDSGGPAFDASGKVVGVVSRGADDCSIPIYGAVASWRDMIVSFTAQAAVLGEYEPPFWVTSGSSDPPETVVVQPGAACGVGRECPDGHACHDGACTVACSSGDTCGDGLTCQPSASAGVSVCLPAPDLGEAGGGGLEHGGEAVLTPASTCAYRPPGRSGFMPVAALGLAVALGFRRSRKRSGQRSK